MATTHTKVQSLEDHDAAAIERLRLTDVYIPPKDAWKKTIGWAKGCPIYDEAVRMGAEWRAEANRQSIEELDALDAGS